MRQSTKGCKKTRTERYKYNKRPKSKLRNLKGK